MKVVLAGTAGTALIIVSGILFPASASTGADFGQHVRECAQVMGFDAEHNPGMHQGFSAWHPHHHCG